MERGSAQHSSRVDEELAAEAATLLHGAALPARDREDLEPEAPTTEEQVPTPEPGGVDPPAAGPSHADVLARSELARWLLPSAFPATAETLLEVARANDAPPSVTDALEGLRTVQRFETTGELWTALGGPVEPRPAPASPAEMPSTALPPIGEPSETVVDPIIRLITHVPRVALATLGAVGRFVTRSVEALTHSDLPPPRGDER